MKENLKELVFYLPLILIALCALFSTLAFELQWGAYPTLQSLIFCFAIMSTTILHDARHSITVNVRFPEREKDSEEEGRTDDLSL